MTASALAGARGIVTGASSGIGRAVAEKYGHRGLFEVLALETRGASVACT